MIFVIALMACLFLPSLAGKVARVSVSDEFPEGWFPAEFILRQNRRISAIDGIK